MNKLFSSFRINNLVLENRFVMSAAADNLASDPVAQSARFANLAIGKVGLIITGGTIFEEIIHYRHIAETVHSHGGKLAVQVVAHNGLRGSPYTTSVVASILPKEHEIFRNAYFHYGPQRVATDADFEEIIAAYAKAAKAAKDIGADAVQIHAAHQSLLSQMLSPLTNQREDKWGGALNNRIRMHCAVYKAIRAEVGNDFPVLIKLGVEDAFADGLQFAEGKIAAQKIAECGYDILEISQGLMDLSHMDGTPMRMSINNINDEAYFRTWCREIKKSINKPTIMTGGIRSYELAEEIINNDETDFIGLCRPLIREPGLIKRWQEGDLRRATCISCNKCVTELLLKDLPLACYLDKK